MITRIPSCHSSPYINVTFNVLKSFRHLITSAKKHDKSCSERELSYKEDLAYYPNTPVQCFFQAVLGEYHMTVDYLLSQCSKNSTNAFETFINETIYANKTFDTNETFNKLFVAHKSLNTNKTAHTNKNKFIKKNILQFGCFI